ncbi:MAG: DUF2993 domain-containing protein [Phormidesmis sp.]
MGSQALDIGEQSISSALEALITSQLDQVDELHIEVHTDPLKLTQGQLDSLSVKGEGLVVQNSLRTAELRLETDAVDISMMKMAAGQFALDEPADAKARIVLMPTDIQAAFNSDYIKQKMRGQKVKLDSGEQVTTDASNVVFTIPEADRIAVEADVMLIEKVESHHIAFSAEPRLVSNGHGIALEDIRCDEATNDMPALTQSLIDSTQELLDLRSFELGDMSLQLTQLDVKPDKLVFQATATIKSFS